MKEQVQPVVVRGEQKRRDENVLVLIRGKTLPTFVYLPFDSCPLVDECMVSH